MKGFLALAALMVSILYVSALAAQTAHSPPILIPNPDGTYGNESKIVAVFPSHSNRSTLIKAAISCGFEGAFVEERLEGQPVSVRPSSYSVAKLKCLKGWAKTRKNLKVNWLQ